MEFLLQSCIWCENPASRHETSDLVIMAGELALNPRGFTYCFYQTTVAGLQSERIM